MKWLIDYLYPRNFDHASIPDLAGKVIVITGGCSGLGFEVARQCALHNASKIIIVSLPSLRLEEAAKLLTASLANPEGEVVAVPADLGDLTSLFHAAEQIRNHTQTINIYYSNAGVSRSKAPLSPDGLEGVLAINHVGNYALLTRLLPILLRTAATEPDVRLVITSSTLAYWSKPLDFTSFNMPFDKRKGTLVDLYSRSKFCNLLFGMQLAKHVRDRGAKNIFVNVGEPGIVFATGVHLQMESVWRWWVRVINFVLEYTIALTVEEGALNLLFLGTSPRIKEDDINGQFYRPFGDRIPEEKLPKMATMSLAEKLWEWTEGFVSTREIEIGGSI